MKGLLLYAAACLFGSIALGVALADGGPVRVMDRDTTLHRYADMIPERVLLPLPDSLRLLCEAGDSATLAHPLPNQGWAFVYSACGDTGLMLPIHRGGMDLWPSPDGWTQHYWVARRYLVALRMSDSTVVAPWYPTASPSYCEEMR